MNKTSHIYRIEIPNLIDDMDLHPFALRLYVHIKRRSGDNGECFENSNNLAKACHMSTGTVSKAKRELVDHGLIQIVEKGIPKYGKRNHHIVVVDVWEKNYAKYKRPKIDHSMYESSSSPHEFLRSVDNNNYSPNEIKKIPIKKIQKEENPNKNLQLYKKNTYSKRKELFELLDKKSKEVV